MGSDNYLDAATAPRILVLIVEDEPDVRSVAVEMLEELGATTAEATSGEDALAYLREHAPDVGLIFTDFELPGRLDGIDLARVALLRWPWIKFLITSGGARIHDVPENVAFLPKPWCAADIRAQMHWEGVRAGSSTSAGSAAHRAA